MGTEQGFPRALQGRLPAALLLLGLRLQLLPVLDALLSLLHAAGSTLADCARAAT
jgi:hypothetical protein